MNTTNLIILLLIIGGLFVAKTIMKSRVNRKIYQSLQNNDESSYMKTLNSFSCKMSYPAFDREFMKLTFYMKKNELEKVHDQVSFILNEMNINDSQKIAVYRQAFYYYIKRASYKDSKKILEQVKQLDKYPNVIHAMDISYDVFVEKKANHIEEIKKKLDNMQESSEGRSNLELMLGLQYAYQGNQEDAKVYFQKALDHNEDAALEQVIHDAMGKYIK